MNAVSIGRRAKKKKLGKFSAVEEKIVLNFIFILPLSLHDQLSTTRMRLSRTWAASLGSS